MDDPNKNDRERSILVNVYISVVAIIFVAYLVYSFVFPAPMTPEEYTDLGPEHNNRWGQ